MKKMAKRKVKKMDTTVQHIFVTKDMLAQQKVAYEDVPLPQLQTEEGIVPVARIRKLDPISADTYDEYMRDLLGVEVDMNKVASGAKGDSSEEQQVPIKLREGAAPNFGALRPFLVWLSWVNPDSMRERVFESVDEMKEVIQDNSIITALFQKAQELNKSADLKDAVGN